MGKSLNNFSRCALEKNKRSIERVLNCKYKIGQGNYLYYSKMKMAKVFQKASLLIVTPWFSSSIRLEYV